jgi:NADH-quinone oxidoreductase subunit K
MNGQVFAAVLLSVAAAETAVGLALIVSLYRLRRTVLPEEADLMRG